MRPAGVLASVLLTGLSAGCAKYQVTRAYAGRLAEERFIDELAYGAYFEGAELEARGELEKARAAYLRATVEDPSSVEAWTRLGAVECGLGRDPTPSFAEAARLDPGYATLFRERARCARSRGREDFEAERRAFELEPEDAGAALDWAQTLIRGGRGRTAFGLLRDFVAREPGALEAWRLLAYVADAAGEPAWAAHARHRVVELEARRGLGRAGDLSDVERGLLTGDASATRAVELRPRLETVEWLALAIVVGRPTLAVDEARRVLGADPGATDVRLLGALAADRAGLHAPRSEWLASALAARAEPLGVLGAAALEELVSRHLGLREFAVPRTSLPSAPPRQSELAARLRGSRVATPRTR